MKIKLKKLNRYAILPKYAHTTDAACDLYACLATDTGEERVVIPWGKRALIKTGIAIAVPEGYAALVCPRSGLALKQGISVLNTPGIVDASYRGDVGVIVINEDGNDHNDLVVRHGDRVAQLMIVPFIGAEWDVVDELDTTERGVGGFGSTGVSL